MSLRSFTTHAKLQVSHPDIAGVQRQIKHIHISLVILLCPCLMALVVSVIIIARTRTVPEVLNLPQAYLPGSPLPTGILYSIRSDGSVFCSMQYQKHDIYFDFEIANQRIVRTIVPARAYTIGQLMIAWGKPTGFSIDDTLVSLYWGLRSVHLYSRLLRPDSQVEFIFYNLEAQAGSTWRGFQRHYAAKQ